MTEQLKASRSTVREALRFLQAQGLVVKGRSRNLVVRRLSRRDVVELYELRELLESHAAGKAACAFALLGAREQGEWKALLRWWQEQVPSGAHVHALGEANRTLHARVQELGGNSHLPRLLQGTLMTLFSSQFRPWLSAEASARACAEHVALLKAILASDDMAARLAMQAHVRSSASTILALPAEHFGPD